MVVSVYAISLFGSNNFSSMANPIEYWNDLLAIGILFVARDMLFHINAVVYLINSTLVFY